MNIRNNKDEDFKKVYSIKLRNGMTVELARQDIIDNNIYKLREKISNLKITKTLSHNNPIKNIMSTLESGVQNKYLYYKCLSLLVFCYIWLIQIMAFINNSPSALSMILISIWGSYAIIRLQIKPHLEENTLFHAINNKSTYLYNNSIFYSLLIVLFLFIIFNLNYLCYPISWNNIGNLLTLQNTENSIYYEYAFSVMLLIILLLCLYNPYNLYEMYIFRLYLGFITVPLAIFSFIVLSVLFYYNILVANMCPNNTKLFLYLMIFVAIYIVFSAFLQGVSVIVFLLLRQFSIFLTNISEKKE